MVSLYIKQHKSIVGKDLPEGGRDAASKLLPALEKVASSKNNVEVRPSLFLNELESLYGFNMEGAPSIMVSIAQAKARACKNGKTLQNPGVLNNMITLYVIPWTSGYTEEMPFMGVAKVILPGVDGINYVVVNGAPEAKVDSEIAEEC